MATKKNTAKKGNTVRELFKSVAPKTAPKKTAPKTAESWYRAAIKLFEKKITKATGKPIQPFHISSGFTHAGVRETKTRGQFFAPCHSSDGVSHIFLNPRLIDPLQLIATIVHEVLHVQLGYEAGHGKEFAQAAIAVGLVRPVTDAQWSTDGAAFALEVAWRVGPFPRGAFVDVEREAPGTSQIVAVGAPKSGAIKKQSTRLIKADCRSCGYTIRITRKWIAIKGLPMCPCGDALIECE